MATRNNIPTQTIPWESVIKRMMIGALIGFFLISLLVFGVDNPHPEWPKYWMIRPLIVTPVAAAFGAAFSIVLDRHRQEGGWKSFAAILLSLLVFIIALWMGTVLGLVGTMWN